MQASPCPNILDMGHGSQTGGKEGTSRWEGAPRWHLPYHPYLASATSPHLTPCSVLQKSSIPTKNPATVSCQHPTTCQAPGSTLPATSPTPATPPQCPVRARGVSQCHARKVRAEAVTQFVCPMCTAMTRAFLWPHSLFPSAVLSQSENMGLPL